MDDPKTGEKWRHTARGECSVIGISGPPTLTNEMPHIIGITANLASTGEPIACYEIGKSYVLIPMAFIASCVICQFAGEKLIYPLPKFLQEFKKVES